MICDATVCITKESQKENLVTDILLVLVGILLSVTTVAAIEYYRQVRKAQKEYTKAKEVLGDIVLSFNRELKREADRLEMIAYKIEGTRAKADASINKVSIIEKKIPPLEKKIRVNADNNKSLLLKITESNKKTHNFEAINQSLKADMKKLEQQVQKLAMVPEIESEPVMPIRREKALASLTETEVIVLEMLSAEGSKTAPEIKNRVSLSREHTSRLMKKLYEKGYLERETIKIPFKYSIKTEMKKFLNKVESEQR